MKHNDKGVITLSRSYQLIVIWIVTRFLTSGQVQLRFRAVTSREDKEFDADNLSDPDVQEPDISIDEEHDSNWSLVQQRDICTDIR